MRRVFLALLSLFLLSGQVPYPQNVNPPNVPSGLDSNGVFTQRQLNFPLDLSFASIFGQPTTSQTTAQVNLGNIVLVLDTVPGFKVDYTVQITTPTDTTPFMIGVVSNVNTTSGQTVITVAVFRSVGGGFYNSWNLAVIGGPIYTISAGGAVAIDAADTFAVPLVGTLLNLTVDSRKAFSQTGQLYLQALGDSTAWFVGTVLNYVATTGALTLIVTQSSQSSGLFCPALQLDYSDASGCNSVGIALGLP